MPKDCPICHGTGEDPDGCGCSCMQNGLKTMEPDFKCQYPGFGCINCNCEGCGGSCCYCGGTGEAKNWIDDGPYEKDGTPR